MNTVWSNGGTLYGAILQFLSHRIWGRQKQLPDGTALAVLRDNRLTGAALFNNYDKDAGTIEITAASDDARWLTRPVLLDMFSFPFRQLGCQAVILRCDPSDTRLGRILGAYGFKRYDIPRLRGRNKGEAVFILGDDDWRANGFHKENAHG